MERVTQKNERGYYLLGDGIYSDWGVPEKFRGDDVDRLAAYEDTGLEPEEIKATFTPEAVIKLAAQALGTTPDRLRDIVFIAFAVYGIFVFHKWHKVAGEVENMMEQLEEEQHGV